MEMDKIFKKTFLEQCEKYFDEYKIGYLSDENIEDKMLGLARDLIKLKNK